MRYDKIDNSLFINNRKRLRSHLTTNSVAILTSSDVFPSNADGAHPFKQNSDFFYLSGIEQEDSILLIYPEAAKEEWEEVLFIKHVPQDTKIWDGDGLSQDEASLISGIRNVRWIGEFNSFFHSVMSCVDAVYLNTNESRRANNEIRLSSDRFISYCKEKYPIHCYKRLAPVMSRLRAIKSDIEIALIKKACDITEKGIRRVMPLIKQSTKEYEIEAELGCEFVKNAASGFAYPPIIASGSNSCVLHYGLNNATLNSEEILLMDVGAEYANYSADVTRVLPIGGKFTNRQRKVYKSVLSVLRASKELLALGATLEEFSMQIVELIKEELCSLGLLSQADKKGNAYRKYFMHNPMHHLGLDTHDWVCHDMRIQPSMVLAIEPAIYLPEEGFGVRLENNYVVTADGVENLTDSIPVDVEEVEGMMNDFF